MNWEKEFENYRKYESKTVPPEQHSLRFAAKIKPKQKPTTKHLWLIAASMTLLFALGQIKVAPSQEIPQRIEQQYSSQINHQIHQLEILFGNAHASNIEKLKTALGELDKEYQNLILRFEEHPDHPRLLQAMTQNLQKRLLLLAEFEQQMNERTTNHPDNETI